MNRYIKLFPLGAVLALAALSASAQTPAPATTASAPATIGRTPQEGVEATRKAVPRSDTGTLVRTSPSAADQAQNTLNANTPATTTATPGAGSTTSGTAEMNGTSGSDTRTAATMRRPRADRN
ncbi:MAG: hypothetical protein JWP96_882 [Polaromonas sp.]|nr:hypothetical protein [Polaromonas sp.]